MNLKRLCRLNSVVIILCYFLPFIPPMCGMHKTKKEIISSPDSISTQIDTISTEEAGKLDKDSLALSDSSNIYRESSSIDTVNTSPSKSDGTFDVLTFLVAPDGNNLSGVGYIYYYTFSGLSIITLPASLVLLILNLLFKRTSTKWIFIIFGLTCMACFGALNFEKLLYGYWITLLFYLSLTILSWVLKKRESSGN